MGAPTVFSMACLNSWPATDPAEAALRDGGFTDGTLVARNATTGPALAEQYGYRWNSTAVGAELLVNVTPVGMAGGPDELASRRPQPW